jgi:predicted alpha/beta superfamily hydrolase
MFKHPEMFPKYFAGSPSIGYSYGLVFEMEKESAKTWTDLNAPFKLATL